MAHIAHLYCRAGQDVLLHVRQWIFFFWIEQALFEERLQIARRTGVLVIPHGKTRTRHNEQKPHELFRHIGHRNEHGGARHVRIPRVVGAVMGFAARQFNAFIAELAGVFLGRGDHTFGFRQALVRPVAIGLRIPGANKIRTAVFGIKEIRAANAGGRG